MTQAARALMPAIPRQLKKKTINIMYLFANNLPVERISELTGVSEWRITKILESERGRAEASAMALQVVGGDPQKMFLKAVPETFAVQMEIMRKKGAKDSTRLMAAEAIQNRALGKPTQVVETNQKSTVRVLLEQLQSHRVGADQSGQPWDIEATWRHVEEDNRQKALESQAASVDTAKNDDYSGI